MSGEYKAIMSAERELVSRFEHVAQLTDREVDARLDYYADMGKREATMK